MTVHPYAPYVEAAARLALIRKRAQAAKGVLRPLYPHQVPPEGPWAIWLLLGGRGSGKTEAGARYVDEHARGPACLEGSTPHRIAIVAPSHDDAVDTCVRGETGILNVNPSIRFRPGALLAADLTWPNGAEAELFGTFAPEDVERFRGPQHCLVWGDEFAAWRKLGEAWDMIEFGLRLGPHPHAILTTTPKPRPEVKEVLARPDTVVSKARTEDNPNLPTERRLALYARYGGTRLGRQELDAEIIDDMPGALWQRAWLEEDRVSTMPKLSRVVVAVDPEATSGEDSAETGIVVAGKGFDGQGYVLADSSVRGTPTVWATAAIAAYSTHFADRIVGEVNNGGEMVEHVLRSVDPAVSYRAVTASRGKATRAEPISALYEQHMIHHVGYFPELEDQLCSWVPGDKSPDRLDALVWAFSELDIGRPRAGSFGVAA